LAGKAAQLFSTTGKFWMRWIALQELDTPKNKEQTNSMTVDCSHKRNHNQVVNIEKGLDNVEHGKVAYHAPVKTYTVQNANSQ